jgi:hypothetical protein
MNLKKLTAESCSTTRKEIQVSIAVFILFENIPSTDPGFLIIVIIPG